MKKKSYKLYSERAATVRHSQGRFSSETLYNEDFIWEEGKAKRTQLHTQSNENTPQWKRSTDQKEIKQRLRKIQEKKGKIIRKNKWQEEKSPEKDCQRIDKNCN